MDRFALHAPRTHRPPAHRFVVSGRRVRHRGQPMLLHYRTESHFAHQCRDCHHVDADFRPRAFGARAARTRDVAQGGRGGAGLHGGTALGVVECACRRGERRDGQFARRPAVSGGAILLFHLSHCLRPIGEALFGGDGQQVDVPLGDVHHLALHRRACAVDAVGGGAVENLCRDGLCGGVRHVCGLSAHDSRATGVAPHGGEYVQLCAAHCGGFGEHLARPGGADRDARRGRGADLHGRGDGDAL